MKKVIVILCVLLSAGLVSAAVPDYLKASEIDEPPSSVKIGDSVAAKMTLVKVGIRPDSATLNIVTELSEPRIEVTIDNVTETYVLKNNEIPLSSDGVEEIKIRISGDAPAVEKQKEIKVLEVTTHVEYPDEDPEDQNDGTITITVSDAELKEAKTTLEDAWDKYAVARSKVQSLTDSGVNTAELESRLQQAREQLDEADKQEGEGDIDSSKLLAEGATTILEDIILDAEKSGIGPVPMDMKRYLVIAGAVIAVLIVALFIKGKREELG